MADVTKDSLCCKGVKVLPYTEWGKQRWDSYDASKGDYAGSCLPLPFSEEYISMTFVASLSTK